MTDRLRAVGEETLLTLIQPDEDETAREARRLLLTARSDGRTAELEFVAVADETNIENQLALLGERTAARLPPDSGCRRTRSQRREGHIHHVRRVAAAPDGPRRTGPAGARRRGPAAARMGPTGPADRQAPLRLQRRADRGAPATAAPGGGAGLGKPRTRRSPDPSERRPGRPRA